MPEARKASPSRLLDPITELTVLETSEKHPPSFSPFIYDSQDIMFTRGGSFIFIGFQRGGALSLAVLAIVENAVCFEIGKKRPITAIDIWDVGFEEPTTAMPPGWDERIMPELSKNHGGTAVSLSFSPAYGSARRHAQVSGVSARPEREAGARAAGEIFQGG